MGASSAAMSRLVGVRPWTLSRALAGRATQETAAHIAVLAAFIVELDKLETESGRDVIPAEAMNRWLRSGKLGGYDEPPIELLARPELASAALADVRASRRSKRQAG
jgi:hypothetical protein